MANSLPKIFVCVFVVVSVLRGITVFYFCFLKRDKIVLQTKQIGGQ